MCSTWICVRLICRCGLHCNCHDTLRVLRIVFNIQLTNNYHRPDSVKDSLPNADPCGSGSYGNYCLQQRAVCSGRTRMKTWCPSPARASSEGPRPSRTVSTSAASSYSNQVGFFDTAYPFLYGIDGLRIRPRSIIHFFHSSL